MDSQLGTSQMTLRDAYKNFGGDQQQDIPWVVRLFENPASPLPFPGKISLCDHDCLHILLGLGTSDYDEAFIVGFTMGNDSWTKAHHIILFKLAAKFLYPVPYRFSSVHTSLFDQGVRSGARLKVKGLNALNLSQFFDCKIDIIRAALGIDIQVIRAAFQEPHTVATHPV